jgi:hypothetical protein
LITEDCPVTGKSCQSVKERVSFLGLCLGAELCWTEPKSLIDIWINKLVDDFDPFEKGLSWYKWV